MKEFLTQEEFDQGTAKGLAVVDIFAVWCGPCKVLGPVFEEISNEITDVTFGKVDCDKVPSVAEQFTVTTVPTVLILKDGKLVNKVIGVIPKEEMVAAIQQYK